MDQEGLAEMEEATLKPAPDAGVWLTKLGKRVTKYVKKGSMVVLNSNKEVKTDVI